MKQIQHDCVKELKEVNLQVTQPRIAALQLFESHNTPLDSEHIITHLEKEFGIDRATVFRILNVFVEKGLIKRLEFGEGKARYELAKEDHHHLICDHCGKIIDFPDTMIPSIEEQLHKKYKFLIQRHSMEFFGLCEDCQSKLHPPKKA